MSEIDDILVEYDYAETVTDTVAGGKLEVTLAEAHPRRNRAFALKMQEIILREGVATAEDLTEELEIELLCATLLKSWNAKRKGRPVPVEDAQAIFARDHRGRLLFREVGTIAADHQRFRNQPSKKKPSSSSSRKASSSAKTRRSTKPKPKPEASRSQTESSAT
ncbi:MAG: hypothetical protein ACR2P3_08690 [Geminicoccaceae bacterium]